MGRPKKEPDSRQRTVSFRLPDGLMEEFRSLARRNRRTLSGEVQLALENHLALRSGGLEQKSESVDDAPKRLLLGSGQPHHRALLQSTPPWATPNRRWLGFELSVLRRLKFASVAIPFAGQPDLEWYLKFWGKQILDNDLCQWSWWSSRALVENHSTLRSGS